MGARFLVALLVGLASQATAEITPAIRDDIVVPPEGCTPDLTIQGRACMVRHVLICGGKAQDSYLVLQYRADGLTQMFRTTRDMQPLMRQTPSGGEELLIETTDPMSSTTLMAQGVDPHDYLMRNEAGRERRIVGQSVLTGEMVNVDGFELAVVKNATVVWQDGVAEPESQNLGYLDRSRGLIITAMAWNTSTGPEGLDLTPEQFILPGETGFMSVIPTVGCGG